MLFAEPSVCALSSELGLKSMGCMKPVGQNLQLPSLSLDWPIPQPLQFISVGKGKNSKMESLCLASQSELAQKNDIVRFYLMHGV